MDHLTCVLATSPFSPLLICLPALPATPPVILGMPLSCPGAVSRWGRILPDSYWNKSQGHGLVLHCFWAFSSFASPRHPLLISAVPQWAMLSSLPNQIKTPHLPSTPDIVIGPPPFLSSLHLISIIFIPMPKYDDLLVRRFNAILDIPISDDQATLIIPRDKHNPFVEPSIKLFIPSALTFRADPPCL